MPENTITTNTIETIRAKLAEDPHIPHPTQIAVTVHGHAATLRGTVGSFQQRRAALHAAKSAHGIRAVGDELHVDPRDRWEDNEIRGAALQALIDAPDAPDDLIDVWVADQWLTLRGEVRHQHETDAAYAAVSGIPGIGGITNRIVVVAACAEG